MGDIADYLEAIDSGRVLEEEETGIAYDPEWFFVKNNQDPPEEEIAQPPNYIF